MPNRNLPRAQSAGGASQVRIIGGQWRRRVLRFAPVPGLRPTPDRVRETLFNWLGQDLTGMSCLDLFAGSGALGFEALSRNAREVVMVERDARARAGLSSASNLLGAGARLTIRAGDALQFLRQCDAQFDLIFLDPPFEQGWLAQLWPRVGELCRPEGRVYMESESAFEPPAPWVIYKAGRAGAVHYQLAHRASQQTTQEAD
jgi:16S rRNA (guanine(966)-N(2))-methyltransferase RsmD